MDRLRDALRSGTWITRERVWLIAGALLLASVAGLLFLVATSHDGVDLQGRPIGTDFSNVYAAGSYVIEGDPNAPFDLSLQYAREQKIFGTATPFYGWHYPPYFLFVAGALADMPYGVALTIWQAGTLLLYLLTIRAIIRIPSHETRGTAHVAQQGIVRATEKSPPPAQQPTAAALPASGAGIGTADGLLLALAFPAVLINIGHGQNGFLTAALLGGALLKLDRAPLFSGALFGLLAYKPQFGLMIPIILAASGRWRCFVAAAVTVLLLTLATTVALGPHVWQAFLASTRFSRTVALEQGNTGWYKIQSVFAWARMWGTSIPVAYALQGALTVGVGGALVWLWRSAAPYRLKAAALCLATILATPYTFDYDMMTLAPAIAFLAANGWARGFGPWEKTALAALWLMPLVARSVAQGTLIPLAVPTMLATFILLLRRSTRDLSSPVAFADAFFLK